MGARLTAVVVGGVFVAALTAGAAHAALFFLFQPTLAKPGDIVAVRPAGTPAGFELDRRTRPFQQPMRLYLVPNRIAGEIRSRFDQRLSFVGELVPDARGRGILRFRVPPLDPEDYAAAVWCPRCAAYSRGRTFFVLGVDDDVAPRYRPLMLLRLRAPPAAERCPVTAPAGGIHGNGLLSTQLRRDGRLVGHSEPDGSISWKLGWVPTRPGGTLTVRGERLDASSPPMRVHGVNWGYSSDGRGSWASAVSFPGEGCWRITGRVRDVSLTFVVRVVRG